MPIYYPFPWDVLAQLLIASLRAERRSFAGDARACLAKLPAPVQVRGAENILQTGPRLVIVNHYARPGFGAWWLAFAVSAALPVEVHWVFTAEWTYPDRLRRQFITPATRWLFQKFAGVYGFTTMPAMPPDPRDVARRARAVRQVLNYARRAQAPLIGLAPEGMDFETGGLGMPPTGAGRFILHLNDLGLLLSPVGVYEAEDRLCVHFGPPYSLEIPAGLAAAGRDRAASQAVMRSIAALLPEYLRGEFG
ncbi:MAG: hypothetical protein JXA78_08720 [Anaerolineales bacterium]|nr:hypothetical protein [Anaerolineales bacterium]